MLIFVCLRWQLVRVDLVLSIFHFTCVWLSKAIVSEPWFPGSELEDF